MGSMKQIDGPRSFGPATSSIAVANPANTPRATRRRRLAGLPRRRPRARNASRWPLLGAAPTPIQADRPRGSDGFSTHARAEPRNAQSRLRGAWSPLSCRAAKPPFCLDVQGLFDGPGVELDPKALAQRAGQFSGSGGRLGADQFPKMGKHIGLEFVRLLGAALAGQKSFQSFFLKLALGLVNGRAGKSKLAGRPSNRIIVGLQRAQRLVFELNQVVGIEEVGLLKEGV